MKTKAVTACVIAAAVSFSSLPAEAVGISNFMPKHIYNNQFTDVAPTKWYAESIRRCYELGLIKGSSETRFSPNKQLTLAEAIIMAARMHSIYNDGTGVFEPTGSDWYSGAVDYAEDTGIIKIGEFLNEYTRYATRSELAYLIYGALPTDEYAPLRETVTPTDVPTGSLYSTEIQTLYSAGILIGNENGSFLPDKPVTRGEAAAILTRVAQPKLRISTPSKTITTPEGTKSSSEPAALTQSVPLN